MHQCMLLASCMMSWHLQGEIAWKLKGEICPRRGAPELRLVGRPDHVVRWSMHGQTDQWSCGFLLDRANRSIVHGSTKGTFPVPRFKPLVLRAFEESRERERERSLLGWNEKWLAYFPFFLYQSGRASVNHCRMMRQHLSRKALGCIASQPRTRSVQLVGEATLFSLLYSG